MCVINHYIVLINAKKKCESETEKGGDMWHRCHETTRDDATYSPACWAGGEVISTTWDLPWRRPQTTRHAAVLHVLTDFELPMYSLHVAVSVLGLDGVTVAHQLHKLLGQDAVLEGRNHLDHHAAVLLYASSTCGAIWINSSVPACIFVVTTSIYTQWYSWLKLMQY